MHRDGLLRVAAMSALGASGRDMLNLSSSESDPERTSPSEQPRPTSCVLVDPASVVPNEPSGLASGKFKRELRETRGRRLPADPDFAPLNPGYSLVQPTVIATRNLAAGGTEQVPFDRGQSSIRSRRICTLTPKKVSHRGNNNIALASSALAYARAGAKFLCRTPDNFLFFHPIPATLLTDIFSVPHNKKGISKFCASRAE